MFLHNYEIRILHLLEKAGSADLAELEERSKLGRDQVLWALNGLFGKGFVKLNYNERSKAALTAEGKAYAEKGLPESRLLRRISDSGVKTDSLRSNEERIGLQWLMKKRLASVDNGMVKISSAGISALKNEFPEEQLLKRISEGRHGSVNPSEKELLDSLKKRGLVDIEGVRELEKAEITEDGIRASKSSDEGKDEIGNLDREMLAKMSWKGKRFSEYDLSAKVERNYAAKKHILKQTIDRIKDIYLSMGFQEISGPAVEPAFWVFDSLFMPQDHPARDKQDSFMVNNPKELEIADKEYVRQIKEAHEKSWRYSWDIDKARQSVLRTHTTSVSSRFIHQAVTRILANEDENLKLPIKMFSIGRLFRNENIDYRHLADFYQHDGIIIGKDLTMANLFDTLINIYAKLGIGLKFKPAYFPFVEPGAEFYGYSDVTDEWVELGGSGIMRSEVTGIARNRISVLAWGAGIERVLLMSKRNGIKSIAELYNNGIGFARETKVL